MASTETQRVTEETPYNGIYRELPSRGLPQRGGLPQGSMCKLGSRSVEF